MSVWIMTYLIAVILCRRFVTNYLAISTFLNTLILCFTELWHISLRIQSHLVIITKS